METELTFVAEQAEMLAGMSRDDFLARPCQVEYMPPAEYRKTFGKPSDEELRRLREAIRDVREGYGDAVPEFEEGTA
ncbi:hypothetical protein AB0D60_10690 [Streptomyces sp. NPDC048306]|uniref:hypothetical protein n=1 Tax=Streptomyces sp. NPDC048306 TaxID=3154502 RepID=UPI0034013D85